MKLYITTGIVILLVVAMTATATFAQNGNYSSSFSRSYSSSSSWSNDSAPVHQSYQSSYSTGVQPRSLSAPYPFPTPASHGMSGGNRSYNSSGGLTRLSLQGVPLLQAIETIEQAGPMKIFISEAANKILLAAVQPVTLAGANGTQAQLLGQVLKGIDVRVNLSSGSLILQTPEETGLPLNLKRIGYLAIEEKLARTMSLNMENTTVPMVLGMLRGQGIIVNRMAPNGMWPSDPVISIQANKATIREILDAVAAQIGCEVKICDTGVQLTDIHLQSPVF